MITELELTRPVSPITGVTINLTHGPVGPQGVPGADGANVPGMATRAGLDAITTADLDLRSYRWVFPASGGAELWALLAGTAAHDPDAGTYLPPDYHAVTNARFWERKV